MYDYIRGYYQLDFRPGQRVRHTVLNKEGVVAREDPTQAHYVQVKFNHHKHRSPCHPQELEHVASG